MPCDKDFGYVRLSQGLTCNLDVMVIYDMIPETNVLKVAWNYSYVASTTVINNAAASQLLTIN